MPGAVDKLEPLKPTPSIEEGDFHSIGWTLFARDLEVEDDKVALGVVHWFTQAVQAGYVPPDAMLRWLAEHFARYLESDDDKVPIGTALCLSPTRRGEHDVRSRHASDERTLGYIQRLALLDLAMSDEDALVYLNDGVPNILPAYRPKTGPLRNPEDRAPEWRKMDLYRDFKRIFSQAEANGRMTPLSQLREYVKKTDRD